VSATGVGEQRGIPAAVRGTGDAVRRFGAGGSVGTGPPAPVAPRTPLSGPAAALCATPRRRPTAPGPETFRPPAGRRVSRTGGPAPAPRPTGVDQSPGHARRMVRRSRGRVVRHFTGAGSSATSRARVGPPLHDRGLVRPVTDAGRSAPSRAWVRPPLHGRGLVPPSRARVGPSPSGAGVGAAAAGDGRAPRALPAYPVGRAARLREGVRPGDVGEPGQPGAAQGQSADGLVAPGLP